MKRVTVLFVLSVITFSAYADWNTAVDVFRNNADLKPHIMKVYSETYNRKGELEKTETVTYRLRYNSSGESESEMLSAYEDGKDVTEQKRKELENGRGNRGRSGPESEMEGIDKHPLDPEVQNDVSVLDTGKKEAKIGRTCSVWNFEISLNDKYSGLGTAWLDVQSSEAVAIEYRIEPLFPFVEEMNIEMEFGTGSSDSWFMDKLKMSGKINMLIMKKGFNSVTTFSDYR